MILDMRYTAHVKFNHDINGDTTYCASGRTLVQLAKSIAEGRRHLSGSPFTIMQFCEMGSPIIFRQNQPLQLDGIATVLGGLIRDVEKRNRQ